MSEINDRGYMRLIDAIYTQAIEDIIAAWRYYQKHGKVKVEGEAETITKKRNKKANDYRTAVGFLKQSAKGRRILKILTEVDEDGYKRLLKSGLHLGSKDRDE